MKKFWERYNELIIIVVVVSFFVWIGIKSGGFNAPTLDNKELVKFIEVNK